MFRRVTTPNDDVKLVRELLAWTGLNVNQASREIGKPNTTLNRYAAGTAKGRMSRTTLAALRERFPTFPGFATMPAANGAPFKFEGASLQSPQGNLPIYGTALGAARRVDGEAIEQVTLNKAEVVEYVKRPVLLNDKPTAYGLIVSGSSMEPRHMDGETIVIDPNGRLRNGEDVVVYLRPHDDQDDGEAARAVLVKRLVRRTSTYIELEQYTPAIIFRVDMEEVVRVDRVMPWSELLS